MAAARNPLPRTAEAIAAEELRAAIVRGDIAPGSKIPQEATARELGMSLIPLREALRTLAGEGVLRHLPQRGYFVPDLPDGAIVQIYEARALVEAEAERLALEGIRPADLEAMEGHLRAQGRAVEDRDPVEMIAANRRFHFAIFERCENPWLLRFVTQLWDAVDPYRVLSYRRMWLHGGPEPVPEAILDEHRRILDALARGRGDRAHELLRRHRDRSRELLAALTSPDELAGSTAAAP
jgi:DNA-binding GntR family transcriptional regulator